MSIKLWRVGISSRGVLIFVLIFLPSILTFLLMLPVISLVFFSALRSIASSVPMPPTSLPDLPPTVSSAALAFPQPLAPPPLAPSFHPPSAVPQAPSLGSFSAALGWGVSALGSSFGVSSAPPGFPPLSAPSSSLFSVPPAPSSLAPAAPSLAPPS